MLKNNLFDNATNFMFHWQRRSQSALLHLLTEFYDRIVSFFSCLASKYFADIVSRVGSNV